MPSTPGALFKVMFPIIILWWRKSAEQVWRVGDEEKVAVSSKDLLARNKP